MKMRASVVVSLLVVLACVVAATPAKAVQPGPRSYTIFDVGGNLIDCIDFRNNGKANALVSGVSGAWFGAPVDALIPDPPAGFPDFVGDSIYSGVIRRWFPGGWSVSRTDFHGTCETQGGASWTFVDEPFGNASCSMTSFNRYALFGRLNDSWTMIQMDDTCAAFWLARPTNAPVEFKTRVK